MRTPRRTALVTLPLVLALAAGCSDDETPSAADGDAAATAAPSAEPTTGSSPADGAADGPVTLEEVTGEATRLTVAQGYISALSAIGAELTAVGGAQTESAAGGTTFVFPVTGGEVTVDPEGADVLAGTVQHDGGLQLSALGRSVTVDELVLDGDQDRLTAMIAGRRVPLLPLSPSDAQVTTSDGQVVVEDSAVSFDAETTNALAEQLGLPVTLPAIEVGSLQATLTGS